jgi:hypothetical protein
VFNHLLRKSAAAMEQAAERLRQRAEDALTRTPSASDTEPTLALPAEQAADAAVRRLQLEAIRQFDHLLEALKPDPRQPAGSTGSGSSGGGGEQRGEPQGGAGRRAPGEGVPPVAELKALKALQAELNEYTRAFAQKHPDPRKCTDQEKAELATLHTEQQKIAELFHKITSSVLPPAGEKP